MPIFRISGADRFRREADRTLYVEAADEHDALREAMRRGIVGGNVEPISLEQLPEGQRLYPARSPVTAADSPLLREPIKTIAIGVFWGMVLFTIAMALLRLIVLLFEQLRNMF